MPGVSAAALKVDLEPVVVEAPAPKPIVAIHDLSLTCETVSG